MSIFKKFKKALPAIGGTIGFAIGGGPMGAAIGSGIGSLLGGGSVEDALKAGAIGGAGGVLAKGVGFAGGAGGGISNLLPSFRGTTMLGFGDPITRGIPGLSKQGLGELIKKQVAASGGTPTPESTLGRFLDAESAKLGVPGSLSSKPVSGAASKGVFDVLGDLSFGEKALLGVGAASLLSDMDMEPEEGGAGAGFTDRPYPEGKAYGTKVIGPITETVYDLSVDAERKAYNNELLELQKPSFRREIPVSSGYAHGGDVHAGGGEVAGPGTGTSDSVPARLSDGEFVLTAKAVRGAGGGDRDVGAARLYDMMSELEATG